MSARAAPTTARQAVCQWHQIIERSSDFGFAFRAHRALIVQHLDNLKFADPRALMLTECTLDRRNVLVMAAPLFRFSAVVPGSMGVRMQPGELLRFKLRNVSPRTLDVSLVLVADLDL